MAKSEAEKRNAVVWAAIGEFAVAAWAAIRMECVTAQDGQRELADGRQVARGMAFPHPAVIFAKGRVKDPVHGLNTPGSPGEVRKLRNRFYPGTDNQ